MTPEQRLLAKILFVVLVLVGVFFGGFGVRGYMANHERTEMELTQQRNANATLSQYADDLKGLAVRNEALRNQVHRLDVTHTKALDEKLAENSRLRTDLDVARRMQVRGATCPKAHPAGDTAGSAGVGDDTAVVLSGETRQLVWDLRQDLIRDRAKLAYLQEERQQLTCDPDVKNPGT